MTKDLVTLPIPAENAAVAKRLIAPIVRAHVDSFTAYRGVKEQMEALAFDCYVQGLLDGHQCGISPHTPRKP